MTNTQTERKDIDPDYFRATDERGNVNGYVVYPSCTAVRDMDEACSLACEESIGTGHARVEDADDESVICRYWNGQEMS